jgi:putative addiction module component (TIGR02574 family)
MTDVDRLLSEAMKLDEVQRSELARRLLDTLDEVDDELEQTWREEVRRRLARIQSGEATLIPWEETERRLFARQ